MTKIKTAQAWWDTISGIVVLRTSDACALEALPHVVTVVHGATEAEIVAALERDRGACEQVKITHDGPFQFKAFGGECKNDHYSWDDPTTCPSCGRKVKI